MSTVVKEFQNPTRQGEIYMRLAESPVSFSALKKAQPVNGFFVLIHETASSAHVVAAQPGVEFYTDPSNPVMAYLVVPEKIENNIVVAHQRQHDTHASIALPRGGIIEVRRQRESAGNGIWQQVND